MVATTRDGSRDEPSPGGKDRHEFPRAQRPHAPSTGTHRCTHIVVTAYGRRAAPPTHSGSLRSVPTQEARRRGLARTALISGAKASVRPPMGGTNRDETSKAAAAQAGGSESADRGLSRTPRRENLRGDHRWKATMGPRYPPAAPICDGPPPPAPIEFGWAASPIKEDLAARGSAPQSRPLQSGGSSFTPLATWPGKF